jgi:flagellar biosynthesis protein
VRGTASTVTQDDDKTLARQALHRAIAVALVYDPAAGDAGPKVVATGRGELAERLLQVAFASGVKVREDADLAEILSAVDVDSVIPVEAFTAVAEVLSYVYGANRRLAEAEAVP